MVGNQKKSQKFGDMRHRRFFPVSANLCAIFNATGSEHLVSVIYAICAICANLQPSERSAMLAFAAANLAKAKSANAWSIVVGHHPVFGSGGPNQPYASLFAPVLNATK